MLERRRIVYTATEQWIDFVSTAGSPIQEGLGSMSDNTELLCSATTESSSRWRQHDRPITAYGLMLAAAVSLVLNYFIKFPTFPEEAAASFRQYREQKLPLQINASAVTTLERYFIAEGVPFVVRTLDPATYTLKGGRVQRLLNRKSSWYAYHGPRNTYFVFQTHPGSLAELPIGAKTRWDRGRSFHMYAQHGATVVYWQERNLC